MCSSQFGRDLALIAHLQKLTCTGILWYSIARTISMLIVQRRGGIKGVIQSFHIRCSYIPSFLFSKKSIKCGFNPSKCLTQPD